MQALALDERVAPKTGGVVVHRPKEPLCPKGGRERRAATANRQTGSPH